MILGVGPIGLAVLEFARLKALQVTVVEPNLRRDEFVKQHYPEVIICTALSAETSYQTVFDATGNAQSMTTALKLACFGGKVIYIGITTDPVILDDPLFHGRELTLMASRNALPTDFPPIIRLIETGQINVERWISQTIDFNDAPNSFAQITNAQIKPIKAIITDIYS